MIRRLRILLLAFLAALFTLSLPQPVSYSQAVDTEKKVAVQPKLENKKVPPQRKVTSKQDQLKDLNTSRFALRMIPAPEIHDPIGKEIPAVHDSISIDPDKARNSLKELPEIRKNEPGTHRRIPGLDSFGTPDKAVKKK